MIHHGPLVDDINSMIPDEILEEILGWLLTSELQKSVSEVSNRFHKLANRDQFWRRKLKDIVHQQRYSNDNDDDQSDGEHAYEPPNGLSQHQLKRCCLFLEHKIHHLNNLAENTANGAAAIPTATSEDKQFNPPSFLGHGSLLFGRTDACRLMHNRADALYGLQRVVNLASSTDHHHESIENILDEENSLRQEPVDWKRIRTNDRSSDTTVMEGRHAITFSFRQPWWSSVPRDDPDESETLAFSTRYPLTLVTEVAIKPYADWTMQTYSWKKLVVRVYNLPPLSPSVSTTETDDEEQTYPDTIPHALCPSAVSIPSSVSSASSSSTTASTVSEVKSTVEAFQYLEAQTPVYESPLLETPPPRNNAWQYHELPYGVIGNVITITLVGKNFRQFDESGYYACVQRVATLGIPLHEAMGAAATAAKLRPREISKRAMTAQMVSKVVPLLLRSG
mmetsp:Transcript_8959/g.21308  ORF Transcript_8959/g.21308 Transcript_8959/m.21308 type:complete len:450 (-) Transcript_8959:145-1494(-)